MRRQQPTRSAGGAKGATRATPVQVGRPTDGEQAAWTRVLEVLLSQPATMESVDHVPDIARIADERDRRIALIVFELLGRPDGLSMAAVLARCHDPADVERVTELARRGADLRQHEASLRSAFQRIAAGLEQQKLEQCKQGLLHSNTGQDADGDSTDAREVIQDGAKKHKHFAPRRLIRQSMDTEG